MQLQSGSTLYNTSYAIRTPTFDGPITDVTTQYVACNGGPNPTTPSSNIIPVVAGSTIKATWRHTLTSTPSNDATYIVDPSHLGPVMAYMKKVTDATTDVGYGSGWFKISEQGLNVATQKWATTDLINNAGVQSITIPSCIANGQYLLRAELIALHAAAGTQGAQLYMECGQINVSGGTGTSSPSTVSFPGAYGQSDPGILINIYTTLTTYTIPGPTPFVCGAAQSTGTSSKATSTSLSTSTKTSSGAVATGTGVAGVYAQCGGQGWTGATVCAGGSTCIVSSVYYSQCLPS
ncbi:glycoside hydrolase family 61 protein [Sclerotinia borealis F-4128]|uniref:AA9 family lytic polysaccharide monooxygenase n=1 Tax=Sclerotinia borealis (strain F-4128) TaxID=1432307 RepID=W9C4J5_SCLBF|nr:glycoside hydrolase family 61 protein [Sclerotinia borealis F-4128]